MKKFTFFPLAALLLMPLTLFANDIHYNVVELKYSQSTDPNPNPPRFDVVTSQAYGINACGYVVGELTFSFPNGPVYRGFLYHPDNNEMVVRSFSPRNQAFHTAAYDLNDQCDGELSIAGVTHDSRISRYYGAVWDKNGSLTELPELGATIPNNSAFSINNSGNIVGGPQLLIGRGSQPRGRAAYWKNDSSEAIDLGSISGLRSSAFSINDNGISVGYSHVGGPKEYPILWDAEGNMFELEHSSGELRHRAYSINNNGDIVGYRNTTVDSAIVWRDTGHGYQAKDLGKLGNHRHARAFDINEHNHIVGSANTLGALHFHKAFIAIDDKMQNLNDLIAPDSDWTIVEARGINDAGQIAASAVKKGSNNVWAVLLDPVNN